MQLFFDASRWLSRRNARLPIPKTPRVELGALTLVAALLFAGCAGPGPYVWYSSLPRTEWSQPMEYLIRPGDTVTIRVYEQDSLSLKGRIREDGRIAMPLIGEVAASGKRPFDVAVDVETRLKAFVVAPRVTVNVDESQAVTVSVLGEVSNRGTITLLPPAGLAQALAQAGGLTEFASESHIYVLRRERRIRFTYTAIVQNQGDAASFPLRTGDVIVAE